MQKSAPTMLKSILRWFLLICMYIIVNEVLKKTMKFLFIKKSEVLFFSPIPLFLDVYTVSISNRKMSFGNFESSANLIWYIVLVIWKLLRCHYTRSRKIKKAFFGHLRLSEEYKYLRTSIPNPLFRSFWKVKQLNKTGSSRDTENYAILSL